MRDPGKQTLVKDQTQTPAVRGTIPLFLLSFPIELDCKQ